MDLEALQAIPAAAGGDVVSAERRGQLRKGRPVGPPSRGGPGVPVPAKHSRSAEPRRTRLRPKEAFDQGSRPSRDTAGPPRLGGPTWPNSVDS